jgi:4-carboxymuconolactone decarboxylase
VLAPKFIKLNDDILFGEVWSREDKLSPRDRCIVTVMVLMTKGIFDNSLKYHISNAKNHGVIAEEMVEIITQAALYAGWPNAWAVFPLAKEVYSEDDTG